MACFGALDTTSKLVTGSVPVVMALWVRDVVQSLATGALLLPRHGLRLLHTRQHGRQALLVAGNAGFQLLTRAMTRRAPSTCTRAWVAWR